MQLQPGTNCDSGLQPTAVLLTAAPLHVSALSVFSNVLCQLYFESLISASVIAFGTNSMTTGT